MRNRSQPTRQARVGQHAASGRRPPGLRQNLRSARGASACGFNPELQTKTPHLGAAARAWLISSGESACVVDIRRMPTELLTHRSAAFRPSRQHAAQRAAHRVHRSGATLDQHQILSSRGGRLRRRRRLARRCLRGISQRAIVRCSGWLIGVARFVGIGAFTLGQT